MQLKDCYLRHDQLENEDTAWHLTEDPRSSQAVELELPLSRIELLVGTGRVRESVEVIHYGARSWRCHCKATTEQEQQIRAWAGPYVEWLTEEQWEQDALVRGIR